MSRTCLRAASLPAVLAVPRSIFLTLLALTTGCASTLDRSRDLPRPTIDVSRPPRRASEPPRFENAEALATAFATLGDDELVALVARALTASPELRASLGRVRAAWALADQGRAARMPTVSGVATATAGSSITGGLGSVDAQSITLSLPVSYEVDLFGRFAADHLGARFDAEATEADAEAAALSLASEVAEAYFDVAQARALSALLTEQRASADEHLGLVRERFARGLVGSADVHSQSRVVAGIDADIALLVGTEAVARRRLAVLLGTDSLPEVTQSSLVSPDPLPSDTFDASMLVDRPDVRAAWLRLEAADASVAASVRGALPTLRISATPGWTTIHSTSQLGERSGSGFTWSVSGTLTVPIFDGLRSRSVVLERRARIDAALAEYENRLLTARAEVENALVLEAQRRLALEALASQRALAAEERAAAEDRYRAGLDSHVVVLIAMDAERALARAELEARRALLSHRVQLVRALGGAAPSP